MNERKSHWMLRFLSSRGLIKTDSRTFVLYNDLILQILTATRWIWYANLEADAALVKNSPIEAKCVTPALCDSNRPSSLALLIYIYSRQSNLCRPLAGINKCRVVCGPIVNLDGRKGIKELWLKYCITRAHKGGKEIASAWRTKKFRAPCTSLLLRGTAAVLCLSSLAGGLIKYIRDDFYDHRINWPRTIS